MNWRVVLALLPTSLRLFSLVKPEAPTKFRDDPTIFAAEKMRFMNLRMIGKCVTLLGVVIAMTGLAWTAFIMLEKAKAPYLDKAEIDRRVEKARYYPSYNADTTEKGFQEKALARQVAQWPYSVAITFVGWIMVLAGMPVWVFSANIISNERNVIDRILYDAKATQVAEGAAVEQVIQEGWKPAIFGMILCMLGAALFQIVINRYEEVVPNTLLYRFMSSLCIAGVGGLVVVSAFSKRPVRRRLATAINIMIIAACCLYLSNRSIPPEFPGGNRTLFGSVVALATSVTIAAIWILANVLAFFYRSAKIKDWLTIPWKYLRIPLFVLSVLLVSMDIMTPLFTEVAASMYWVLFLIALQIAATSQLLVCGVIFGFTRFTKWKLFLFSVGLYILLVHTSAVTIMTAFSTASGSFVVWLIGSVVFDFVLVLPYSLWLGRQRIMHTVWESTFLNDKPV